VTRAGDWVGGVEGARSRAWGQAAGRSATSAIGASPVGKASAAGEAEAAEAEARGRRAEVGDLAEAGDPVEAAAEVEGDRAGEAGDEEDHGGIDGHA
jgi:hypothetical protein